VDYFVKIDVSVMESHIIHCIRDESESRVPDDVFLETRARPQAALDDRVTSHTADRDLDLHTRGVLHAVISTEENTMVASTGARVTNSHTSGLTKIVSTMSVRSTLRGIYVLLTP
jgi:hypothetical protein